jgi:light-regulated signal transduction histidine kinase (bacteriophytochrome)
MLAPFDAAQASAGAAGLEVAARRKDGKIFPLSLSVSEFKIDGITHYSGILRDITAQKQAAENRERLLTQLTQSNTELERFAYAASHDMQEPVRMVHNFSQILQRDYAGGLDPEAREYLDIIGGSALRLRDMIRDLLEHGRAGAEAVSLSEVDMNAEFARVRANLQALIRETGAMITRDKLPRVRGDQVQLMRLLQNLIINGIKFQPPGQVPWIHVSAVPVVGNFLVSVRDNGIGIDPAYIEEIFQPFRRLHSAEAIAGTGLGLSLCRKIVENHGGRIWADSTPGTGTVIFFTLPNST